MTIAIMQPYLFPYIGYFQLIKAVDKFVIYDNIEFTKKGWINRNRILNHQGEQMISVPIKKDSDFLDIRERQLADNYLKNNHKILRKIEAVYRKAPCFDIVFPLISDVLQNENHNNLFDFILYGIHQINKALQINTEIIISSEIKINHELKGGDKVKAICRELNATRYINSIGGKELYEKEDFKNEGIELYFLKPLNFEYKQYNGEFIPWLSIIDVMMFNTTERILEQLNQYKLI